MRQMAWLQLAGTREPSGFLDALAVPANPIAAPSIGEDEIVIGGKSEPVRAALLRLHRPANFAGVPAISLPCGFTSAGLPVGLQLLGMCWTEKTLLRIAHAFEQAHPFRRPSLGM
jgi:aspartyl-tRNA(Asn)/glutamyl-tRNA(Gln) amidotransferase subunit A